MPSRWILTLILLCLAGCKNQEPESAASQTPPPVPPAIAPGSVELVGQLSDCTEAARTNHCFLTVSSVVEYGAGTTQLPAGSRILVDVRTETLSEFRTETGAEPTGRELRLTIHAERGIDPGPDRPAWRVSSLTLP